MKPGRPSRTVPARTPATLSILIAGMHGDFGRQAVLDAIETVPGVIEAQVSLYRALATVRFQSPCRAEDLLSAVETAGFQAQTT